MDVWDSQMTLKEAKVARLVQLISRGEWAEEADVIKIEFRMEEDAAEGTWVLTRGQAETGPT